MLFLVTGATGYVGSRVLLALRRRGHDAVGLVPTVGAAERLRSDGNEAIVGDLARPYSFRAAALSADGVIHTAFGHGIDFMAAVEEDLKAAAQRGVRSVVVRPAIFFHGHGASQFVPMLVRIARERGEAGYVRDGQNRIATVHVDDLAELFVLAAEAGEAGAIYNGAGRDISTAEFAAAAVAGNAGVKAVACTPECATEVWGPFPAMLLAINNGASGQLAWRPYSQTTDLGEELSMGSYSKLGIESVT